MLYLSKKDRDGVIQEVYQVVGHTIEFYVIQMIWSAETPILKDEGVVEVVQKSIPHVMARYQEHQTLPCED